MINVNKISFTGCTRYGLNPDVKDKIAKQKTAQAISKCPANLQEKIADTINETNWLLKYKTPKQKEFVINAEYVPANDVFNARCVLTVADFEDYLGNSEIMGGEPVYFDKCEIEFENIDRPDFDRKNFLESLEGFRKSVYEKYVEPDEVSFTPNKPSKIFDYLV